MARLVFMEMPEAKHVGRKRKYEKYMDLVREFDESGEAAARVDEDEDDCDDSVKVATRRQRMCEAIRRSGIETVRTAVRGSELWLARR